MKQRALKSLVYSDYWYPFLFAQEPMPIGAGQMYIEVNNLSPAVVTKPTGDHVIAEEVSHEN